MVPFYRRVPYNQPSLRQNDKCIKLRENECLVNVFFMEFKRDRFGLYQNIVVNHIAIYYLMAILNDKYHHLNIYYVT